LAVVNSAYDKTKIYGIGHGYDRRPNNLEPSSILVHTTNNGKPTPLQQELNYLRDASGVACCEVIPKDGDTVYTIVPAELRAWHAGSAKDEFINSRSIGFEMHCSVGEKPTSRQLSLLSDRVLHYSTRYSIPKALVETHRFAALPKGRKSDPEGMTDQQFYAWREATFAMTLETRVIGVKPSVTFNQYWAYLRAHKAPIDAVVAQRSYTLAEWLDIDPAYVAAAWRFEQGEPIPSGEVGSGANNPLNLKNYGARWPSISLKGSWWNLYESQQLGLFHAIMHLKQIYGAEGLLTLEQMIPKYIAQPLDSLPVQAYIRFVKAHMSAMARL